MLSGTDAVRVDDLSVAYSTMVEIPHAQRRNRFAKRTRTKDIRALEHINLRIPAGKAIGLVDYWNQFGWPRICRPASGEDFECD